MFFILFWLHFSFWHLIIATPAYHGAFAPLLNVFDFRDESKDCFEPDQTVPQYHNVTVVELLIYVLLHIFEKLDNFSLIGMSLTCKNVS